MWSFVNPNKNLRQLNIITIYLMFFSVFVAYAQNTSKPINQTDTTISQAQLLIKQGKSADAENLLNAELIKKPNDISLNYWLGKSLYRQGKYQIAIEKLSLCLDKINNQIDYKEAVQMLGLSHYLLGHLAETIPYFEKIIKWSPENNEIAYALGISYIQTRQPEKSRETYAHLFGIPTNSAAAYLINAQMHVRQRFEETAVIELNEAIKLDPKLPQANFVLGELAIYKAEIDKGIIYLNKEISLNPTNAMAYYRLGEALSRQLKWDEAIAPLQKSIWMNPFFSGPYIVLGKVYLKKNDFANAQNMLRRSIDLDPRNFGAHYLLAQVLQQSGNLEEAKKEFAIAEQLRVNSEKEP
jgi:tetratricopeptide (TPR) repeat protein